MKAVISIPLTSSEAVKAKKAIEMEDINNRSKTIINALSNKLEIVIESKDLNAMRAAINTVLKTYKVHDEVKKCLKNSKIK